MGHQFLGFYGLALVALGMLSNLSLNLAIDAYCAVADNAYGLASSCDISDNAKFVTENLDSAGKIVSSIGRSYATSCAALVGLSLLGAFITKNT